MAGYRQHISISGLLGSLYGTAAVSVFHFTPVQGILAGILSWVAGMLPDLDSQSGRPVREVFSLLAAIAPLTVMGHLRNWAKDPETTLLLAIGLYAAIRYGGAFLLGKLSVHRGMFHSLPALLIAAELAFLLYDSPRLSVRFLMAGGVAAGFLSHLVLDELYAVEWTGVRLRLNQFAGSAVKLLGPRLLPNLFTYALLAGLTYATLVQVGAIRHPPVFPEFLKRRSPMNSLSGRLRPGGPETVQSRTEPDSMSARQQEGKKRRPAS